MSYISTTSTRVQSEPIRSLRGNRTLGVVCSARSAPLVHSRASFRQVIASRTLTHFDSSSKRRVLTKATGLLNQESAFQSFPSALSGSSNAPTLNTTSAMATHYYWVIDDSGSMSSFQQPIRNALNALLSKRPQNEVHRFCCFSSSAQYAENLGMIRYQGGSTNIAAGFSLLNQKVLANLPLPSKIVTVFISDGADTVDQWTIVSRLKALGGNASINGVTSVLFTIAVGAGFPTNMVVDALRPNYHNASDYLPLVFPLEDTHETTEVFSQLSNYMFEYDHLSNEPPAVDENSSQEQLEAAATAIYNYHVMKASREQSSSQCEAILTAGKKSLEGIVQILEARDQMRANEMEPAKKVEALKPLVSRQIAKYKVERASGLTIVRQLTEKLNQLIDQTLRGQLLSRLNDVELAKALGYGNVAGKHLTKSLRYNSASFSYTLNSLLEYLNKYGPDQAAADSQVADYLMTQEESISDAKACVGQLASSTMSSIVSLVDVLAIIGRTLQVKIGDGVQINPWLVQVVGMPTVMKMMNSVDFFEQHKGHYKDEGRNEEANCLLPVTANPKSILQEYVGQHLTSFFLCKNEALNFPQSLASLVGATITYCMSQPQPLAAWLQDEVTQALTTYNCVYHGGSQKLHGIQKRYLERLASDKWKTCLVTEDRNDWTVKCEHLTKLVLAMALLIQSAKEGQAMATSTQLPLSPVSRLFSSEELREIMIWTMVEMVGRGMDRSKAWIDFLPQPTMHKTVEQLLDSVPFGEAMDAYTLSEAMNIYQQQVKQTITITHPHAGLAVTPESLLGSVTDLGISYYQFNEKALVNIFANLDAMAGNDAPEDYFAITPAERLQILATAYDQSVSAERCALTQLATVDASGVAESFIADHVRKVVLAAPEHIVPAYKQRMVATHVSPVRFFPEAFTKRYLQETGRDLEAHLCINPETRMPRNACTQPDCPHFLRIVPAAKTQEDKPRISDRLLNHLGVLPVVPAYMRCVVNHAEEDPEAVAAMVLEANELLPCEPGGKERAMAAAAKWGEEAMQYRDAHSFADLVAADIEAYKTAGSAWGGYEEFKKTMDEKVYAAAEADDWTVV